MIIKNQFCNIEYGDYNNNSILKPICIEEIDIIHQVCLIRFEYADGDTISLCSNMDEIDFNSFGLVSHIEYTLYLIDYNKRTSQAIIKANNKDDLIQYQKDNKELITNSSFFSIGHKVIID